MTKIEEFVKLITGRFDNKEQFDAMKKAGKTYPYAQHVNTVCNDKIKNLPADFKGMFIVEESYYENEGKRHASPHLFLITEKEDRILLSSYEIPNGEDKNTFSYEFMKEVEYIELKNVPSKLNFKLMLSAEASFVIKEIIASIPEYPVCGIEVIFGTH